MFVRRQRYRSNVARSAMPGAFTLVELLVVIAILVILLAVTIPTMRTSVKGREIREAARQINVIFSRAKSLALVRGRPVGVWIERLTGTPSASSLGSCAKERYSAKRVALSSSAAQSMSAKKARPDGSGRVVPPSK